MLKVTQEILVQLKIKKYNKWRYTACDQYNIDSEWDFFVSAINP